MDRRMMIAPRDRRNYPFGLWYLKYLWLALFSYNFV